MWHVFRYDDVQRVLSEHATFSSRIGGDNPSETGQLFAASLINTDPPRHRQLRSLVSQAFTPRSVEALGPRISDPHRRVAGPGGCRRRHRPDRTAGLSASGDRDRGAHGHSGLRPGPVQAVVRRDREPNPPGRRRVQPHCRQPGNGGVLHGHDRGAAAPAGPRFDQRAPRGRDRRAETQSHRVAGILQPAARGGKRDHHQPDRQCGAVLHRIAGHGGTPRRRACPAPARHRRGAALPLPRPVHVPALRRRHDVRDRTIPQARRSLPGSARRTATGSSSRARTSSTSNAHPTVTSPSGRASTSASALPWPGWRPGSRWRPCSHGCRGWP